MFYAHNNAYTIEAIDHDAGTITEVWREQIVPVSKGGDPFPGLDQLMSLCERCHNRKSRIVEQQGKELTIKGCDEHGMPLDPNHPWYK